MINIQELISMKPGKKFQDWLLIEVDGNVMEWAVLTIKRTKRKYKILVQDTEGEIILKTSVIADVNNSCRVVYNLLNSVYELWDA